MILEFKRILIKVFYIILMINVFFLSFRFVLKLFGANPTNFFAAVIYLISDILILPFLGIFPDVWFFGNAIFDTVALFSLIAYVFIISLIIGLLNLTFSIANRTANLPKTTTP